MRYSIHVQTYIEYIKVFEYIAIYIQISQKKFVFYFISLYSEIPFHTHFMEMEPFIYSSQIYWNTTRCNVLLGTQKYLNGE